ncbi:LysR family transcriptional regulator [Leeia sp. TBRC 13508]|uniref:LysR family transcriptional regulator n=1 Tax=Leeia speluncae TaxID=2884804 RepID=A0ABS8D6Y7_9NEIS|nr:LysR family transcriptional regulator [Leeia speluncae]MCB6183937.1 LysR family transcriptional regulator [Leeia speluncae]
MKPLLPLPLLQAFEAAARLKNFSKAADEMGITQSAISQQVRKLEDFVGQTLFTRSGNGVGLSAAGEVLFQSVYQSLQLLNHGLERIEPYRDPASVIINVPADVAHGWLIPKLPQLRKTFPSQEIWLTIQETTETIDRIDVDIAITRKPIFQEEIECTPLLEDEYIAVCSREWEADLTSKGYPGILNHSPLLCLERDPTWGGLLARSQKIHYQRSITSDDPRVLLDASLQSAGIAYLPRLLCLPYLATGKLIHLSQIPSQLRGRLWIARSLQLPRTPIVNEVFDWLAAN